MPVTFTPLPTALVRALQAGGADAYGLPPERRVSDGGGVPCRHCLEQVAEGDGYLVLAARPFPALQPYAETGPIFLHADPCPAGGGATLPAMLGSSAYILRGYGADDRIVYGTGRVVPTREIPAAAEALLERGDVAYVHVRSASNNCYQVRVDRAG